MDFSPRRFLRSLSGKRALLVAAGSRLAVLLCGWIGLRLLGAVRPDPFLLHGGSPHPCPAVDLLQRWDSFWLLDVARRGYQFHGVQPQVGVVPLPAAETNVTVFPLYPLLVAALARLVGDASVAGALVSMAAFLAAAQVLHDLAAEVSDEDAALWSVVLLAAYPTGFIFGAIYSESLFLLLTLLAFRAARRRQAVASGLWGLLASATRLAGGLLAPCLLLEHLGHAKEDGRGETVSRGLLAATLATCGWLGFFLYLRHLTGDLLVYFTAQQGWHKALVAPWSQLAGLLSPALLSDGERLLDLGSLLLFVPLVAAGSRWPGRGLSLYLLLGTLMPLSSSNLLGLPRYLMVLFPGFMVLARGVRGPAPRLLLVLGMSLVQGAVLLAWLRWRISL